MTTAAEAGTGPAPIFIVCAARTGSTLLRVLLDTHKQVACPPETHMARVCESLERTWRSVNLEGGLGELPPEVLARIGRTAAEPLDSYARARGKSRWCDKSLDNNWLTPLLAQIYPDAQFIVLLRHCLDFVMSGLEAACWGFGAYGFEDYARKYPGNSVQALVTYWCDHVESLLGTLDRFPDRAVGVRYEDMVNDTDATMRGLVSFLGLTPQENIGTDAFTSLHDLGGGDHKIPFTEGIDPGSVGTGRRVPVSAIPADLRERMNAALVRIGYAEVGDDWNHRLPEVSAGEVVAGDVSAAARVFGAERGEPGPCAHDDPGGALVVLDDLGVRWTVSLESGSVHTCDRACATGGRMLVSSTDLRRLISGELNVGSALRTGALRAKGSISTVAAVIEALRAPAEQR